MGHIILWYEVMVNLLRKNMAKVNLSLCLTK